MVSTPSIDELVEGLAKVEELAGLDYDTLAWLAKNGVYKTFTVGENIFYPGMPTDHMQIILSGAFRLTFPQGREERDGGIFEGPIITGLLPFSRMTEAKATGTVIEEGATIQIHRDQFVDLVNASYELAQRLVGAMSTRIRNFTQSRLQDEKLLSLGKLSAGLAHELNNPASAIVRSVEELYKQVHNTPEGFKAVITMKITPEQTDDVNAILFKKLSTESEFQNLGLLAQESRKDDLIDWLSDNEVDNEEEVAEILAEFDFTEDDLDDVADILEPEALAPVVKWIRDVLNMEKIVTEIRDASTRIADLISSIKTYSHMDQAKSKQAANIHEGIKTTIMMLKHKLKKKQISLDKNLDLSIPKVEIYPGELNQVWTNLIDNAIDAMDKGGQLCIKTYVKHQRAFVEISDSGHGIPEEILSKIYDPFFTTKGVNEGTGLGLEVTRRIVVERHKGSIDVASKPGKTTFTVCLPLQS